MKAFRSVILVLLVALTLLPGCGRKERIIPRDKMVDIYADLFLADQWLRDQGTAYVDADTMRFYEPVFRRYGYTTLDFRNSCNHYLKDSRRFARILQRASAKLSDHAKYLDRLSTDIQTVEAEIRRLMNSATVPPVLYDSAFFARSAGSEPDMRLDDRGAWMPWFPPPAPDTVAVADSVPVPTPADFPPGFPHRDRLPKPRILP